MYNSTLTNHEVLVTLPFGKLQPTIDWCKTNCHSEWAFSLVNTYRNPDAATYRFYFESDTDYIAFEIWNN